VKPVNLIYLQIYHRSFDGEKDVISKPHTVERTKKVENNSQRTLVRSRVCWNWLKRIYTNLSTWPTECQRSESAKNSVARTTTQPDRKESVKRKTPTLTLTLTPTQTEPERKAEMNHFIRVGNAYDLRHKSIRRLGKSVWGKPQRTTQEIAKQNVFDT